MLKRLGAMVVAVAVAALAVGSVAPATSTDNDDDNDRERTIRVLATNTEEAPVDVGEPGESLGDSFVFTSKLTKHGEVVGHAGLVCTVTSIELGEALCVGTARFKWGQIAAQGLVSFTENVSKLAITGGTGAFEGAEGTLVVRTISETKERLTFHIDD